jgi:hypothetical protein
MPAATLTTYDEMIAHLDNLRNAAHALMHAALDDGCGCEMEPVCDDRGKPDFKATLERHRAYENALANPYTVWGWEVSSVVGLLHGTAYEISEIPIERLDARERTPAAWLAQNWPHPSPLTDVAMGNETEPAAAIDRLEPALRALLIEHVSTRPAYAYTEAVKTVGRLLADTEYSYGADW